MSLTTHISNSTETLHTNTPADTPVHTDDVNIVPTPPVRSSRFIPSAGWKGTYKWSAKFQPPTAKWRPGRAAARGR